MPFIPLEKKKPGYVQKEILSVMHQQFIETNSLFARKLLSNGKVLYEINNLRLANQR